MDIHVEDIEHLYNNPSQYSHNTLDQKPQLNNKAINKMTNNKIINKNTINRVEDVPENNFSVNVVKKNREVSFSQDIGQTKQSQSIPKPYAKMTRPIQPSQKEQLSYDDILSKMGMFVVNGQLHLKGNGTYQTHNSSTSKMNVQNPQMPENSYIYNKYFKDAFNGEEEPRRPTTLLEYRDMLIKDIIQKARIKQIKSKKLIMPTSNINVASGPSDLNKLFTFSQR